MVSSFKALGYFETQSSTSCVSYMANTVSFSFCLKREIYFNTPKPSETQRIPGASPKSFSLHIFFFKSFLIRKSINQSSRFLNFSKSNHQTRIPSPSYLHSLFSRSLFLYVQIFFLNLFNHKVDYKNNNVRQKRLK